MSTPLAGKGPGKGNVEAVILAVNVIFKGKPRRDYTLNGAI